ncbi:hypothetical protein [Dysgonomonas sp. 520]|uniref:hypothetical protein n=1 Tax=Dysgonomonas sp. 520 TaxID=2302931 RepID=UPI0013D4BC9D|nr:hypothetical protein [Dysgonomonas sp. 520]NDW09967.1 hypothetical protein [Dysgonomonas sp. 520]
MAFQQRKKDYLQRLIEEFFAKLHKLTNEKEHISLLEKTQLLVSGFQFFYENFDIKLTDTANDILEKIGDYELSEQYARLLVVEYECLEEDGNKDSLSKALEIVEYLINTDTTYSWDRSVIREDILRLLEKS